MKPNFAKKQIHNPYSTVSLSDLKASFITYGNTCTHYIAHIIVTLDFDCSLNMHEHINQTGFRFPRFYRVVLNNLIKSQKKRLVDPIKDIFQMTLLISQNP